MKYKVGDRVKVVCDDKSTSSKVTHYNKIYTIANVNTCKPYPYVFEENGIYRWRDSELEPANDTNKIVITTDGKTTLARMYQDGEVVKSAQARCCPEDTFDFATGANLAYARLMGITIADEEKKPEEPTYYSGKVVCVKSQYPKYWTVGKIYEIIDGRVKDNEGNRRIRHRTFEEVRHMGSIFNEFIPLVEDNEPLTIDQLMKMNGKQVWLSSVDNGKENFTGCYTGWYTVDVLGKKLARKDGFYEFHELNDKYGFRAYLTEQKAK